MWLVHCADRLCGSVIDPSKEAAVTKWNTRAALTTRMDRVRVEALEEAAKVAGQLGGDRERLPTREGNDAEARGQAAIRAQHVRAKSIATAIRALKDSAPGPAPTLESVQADAEALMRALPADGLKLGEWISAQMKDAVTLALKPKGQSS